MLRRLHPEQPESFAFTPGNLEWAKGQIAKYPEGRQASAVIPLLWRAQEQEGWVSRPAIEAIAEMLGMAYIRVLEVASFYFMFQLQPVGSVAHIQICGTTSCMICGAEDLIAVCKAKIAPNAHELSADGKFSWEEVECLGACANAPMAQIGKDYYEDLTEDSFGELLDAFAAGETPLPGSRKGRFASEPLGGLTSLTEYTGGHAANGSVERAEVYGDTIMRISEQPKPVGKVRQPETPPDTPKPTPDARDEPVPNEELEEKESKGRPEVDKEEDAKDAEIVAVGAKPEGLSAAREGGPDDLKKIKGVGPKLEGLLHSLGFYHFDQVAAWSADEVAWVDEHLEGFKGRVTRDNWVEQAKALAAED
ncbi:NADH-quinone oxidoreductase subunit E [Algicella marina]|uniref:NADH-quinone oxidoreductase subunit E n=1 Tax=Algicella marina TaxID=2683284 RepID=A0A6P1SVY0_9RHOB|nr:NADH-quinone oxidoreductase subunit E [Algicella marina]QHQ34608.1 NADH-quinone oxidoreductase subunit E [Algicella marina]